MRRTDPWLRLGFDAWFLGLEASLVVAARAVKLASGGVAAQAEMNRMVTEKVSAALALQMTALTGGLGTTARGAASKTLRHYRTRVRANMRRLTR